MAMFSISNVEIGSDLSNCKGNCEATHERFFRYNLRQKREWAFTKTVGGGRFYDSTIE